MITPSKKWDKKVTKLNKDLNAFATKKERDEYIDKHPYWRAFKQILENLSYGKCWYSEAREIYSHYHVDHFRPKKRALDVNDVDQGGYWWLTYDWTNYRICGSVGNTKKNDYFPVIKYKAIKPTDSIKDEDIYFLDPTDKDDIKLINFNEDGKAVPANPDPYKIDYQRADITIIWFDLNYDALRNERRRIWKETARDIRTVQQLAIEYDQTRSTFTKGELKRELEKLRRKIAPCTELSATIRCCLRSSGLKWALDLLQEQLNPTVYCKE